MFYTIIPIEYIFTEDDAQDDPPKKPDQDGEIEVKIGNVSLMIRPHLPGQYKINRIISTDARDYLKAHWQPGTIFEY